MDHGQTGSYSGPEVRLEEMRAIRSAVRTSISSNPVYEALLASNFRSRLILRLASRR